MKLITHDSNEESLNPFPGLHWWKKKCASELGIKLSQGCDVRVKIKKQKQIIIGNFICVKNVYIEKNLDRFSKILLIVI
jgi:hypothetical protein